MPKSHKNSWTVSNEGAESTDDDLDDNIANQEAVEILDAGEPSNKKRRSSWKDTNTYSQFYSLLCAITYFFDFYMTIRKISGSKNIHTTYSDSMKNVQTLENSVGRI